MLNATTRGDQPEPERPIWDRERVAEAFSVSRETLARLDAYVALLGKWQTKINLIGRGSETDIWGRHIADSLQLADLAPPGAQTWLDLGSGAGLPGLILAIALGDRPGHLTHLVEANARKCAFLRVAAAATAAPVMIHQTRIEALAVASERPRPEVITARALAPLAKLIALAVPFMWKNTILILPKGQDVECELTKASISWKLTWDVTPSRVDPSSTILSIEEAVRHGQ